MPDDDKQVTPQEWRKMDPERLERIKVKTREEMTLTDEQVEQTYLGQETNIIYGGDENEVKPDVVVQGCHFTMFVAEDGE